MSGSIPETSETCVTTRFPPGMRVICTMTSIAEDDLAVNRNDRQIDRHQHQHFQPLDDFFGAVGVDGGHRAVVAGVHGLQHVDRFGTAAFADDDPVGPHAQGVLDEVANRIGPGPFDVGLLGFPA